MVRPSASPIHDGLNAVYGLLKSLCADKFASAPLLADLGQTRQGKSLFPSLSLPSWNDVSNPCEYQSLERVNLVFYDLVKDLQCERTRRGWPRLAYNTSICSSSLLLPFRLRCVPVLFRVHHCPPCPLLSPSAWSAPRFLRALSICFPRPDYAPLHLFRRFLPAASSSQCLSSCFAAHVSLLQSTSRDGTARHDLISPLRFIYRSISGPSSVLVRLYTLGYIVEHRPRHGTCTPR